MCSLSCTHTCTGITELCITGEDEQAAIFLISWLIGSHCRLPVQLELPQSYKMEADSLMLEPATMQLLQQRLASLTCNTTSEALISICNLTSLTTLQLYDTDLLNFASHETRELPRLNVLKLSKCTFQFATLLGAVTMPRLQSLLVHSDLRQQGFSEDSLKASSDNSAEAPAERLFPGRAAAACKLEDA